MGHDSYDHGSYKKRCYCQRCCDKYDEWCKEREKEGCVTCKKKCRTICEIVCEQPKTVVTKWGFKKEYEGKWEEHHDEKKPKHCDKCKKKHDRCECHGKKHKKSHKRYD
jgi:hypothetical protein